MLIGRDVGATKLITPFSGVKSSQKGGSSND